MVLAVALGRRAHADVVPWSGGLLVAAAALFYWQRPLGSSDGWAGVLVAPQLLVAAALGILLSTELSGLPRFFRRIAGRSTKR